MLAPTTAERASYRLQYSAQAPHIREHTHTQSQAVDLAALRKTNLQTILNVVMVMGFLAHG
jgi:hypothetical protein